MSDEQDRQPVHLQLPPADAVEGGNDEPVVDYENHDGYEADDEGDEGWPQDPFDNDDNMSEVTVEGNGQDNREEAETEQPQANEPDNQPPN